MKNNFREPIVQFNFREHVLDINIETERFFIRSYHETDLEYCMKLYGDTEITKYFDYGRPRTEAEIQDYIIAKGRKFFNQGIPYGLFSIFDKNMTQFLGQVDLLPLNEPTSSPGIAEIGCILHKAYQNQLVGTEVVSAVIFDLVKEINDHGFPFCDFPIKKIIGTVHPNNAASQKLIENLGMTFDKFEERFNNPRLWYSIKVIENGK